MGLPKFFFKVDLSYFKDLFEREDGCWRVREGEKQTPLLSAEPDKGINPITSRSQPELKSSWNAQLTQPITQSRPQS